MFIRLENIISLLALKFLTFFTFVIKALPYWLVSLDEGINGGHGAWLLFNLGQICALSQLRLWDP